LNRYFYIATIIAISSCGLSNNNSDKNKVVKMDSVSKKVETVVERKLSLTDKNERFLWRENKYDKVLKDTFNSIMINEELCKTLTNPERAALGFVATFIGSECNWDGQGKSEFGNLKCKTLTALDLGYQCSDKHLGFLRNWFKNDIKSLKELENCPIVPDGATRQETFDYINLIVKDKIVSVEFGVSGVDMHRGGDSWSWTETDQFQIDDNNSIKLIKKAKSKVKREQFGN